MWLREFRLNGFVILRNFLPREFVESLHSQLTPLLQMEYERAVKGETQTLRGPARIAFDLKPYAKLLKGSLGDDRFQKHPVIEELVDEILGSWVRGWTQVECVWKDSAHMDFHSDQTLEDTPDLDALSTTQRVTYNIPLVDFTWSNGALEMLPGSHHLPRSFLSARWSEVANLYPVPLHLVRGDAILRDGNTLHRGTPNLTDEPRPMLDQTFKAAKP